jgi:O-antigen/teichoic acid export membrane protein
MSYPINLAFLQGLQSFGYLALATGALGPLKYGFCVLLVLLGLGVHGVLLGLILCYLSLFVLAIWPIYRTLRPVTGGDSSPPNLFARAFPEFIANLCFAFMTQFDLVIVKHLFDPHLTGTYAVAAVLGRAVMYLPVSLVLALFPMVTESHALNRDPRPFLWKALSYTLLLSGTGALLCWLFPDLILGFLFGRKYLDASPLLRLYGMAMLPLAIILVLMNFAIAQGQTRVWLLLLLGAVSEMSMICILHSDPMHVLAAVFVGGTVSLTFCMYAALRSSPVTPPLPRDQVRGE